MTLENLDAKKQTANRNPRAKVVPTEVAFCTGGALAIDARGAMTFIRDSGEPVPFIPRTRVKTYHITLHLTPSGDELRLHDRMSGRLRVDANGKMTSVYGKSTLPFLSQEAVTSFEGHIELADGRHFRVDHEGRLFGLSEPNNVDLDVCGPPVPESAASELDKSIDFAELCRRIVLRDVLDLLGWTPLCQTGTDAQGPCPLHEPQGEDDWKFFVDLAANTFECRSPGCEKKGNQLDLYAAATGLPVDQAAVELCERMSMEVPRCLQ